MTTGTTTVVSTEVAVMRSLRWFQETQNPDGSWSADKDPKAVGTALAVLTFLSHGETPTSVRFGESVRRGLEFLLSVQQENGTFEETGTHRATAHGIVTLALCEAYAMMLHPNLRTAAEKALSVILVAQRASGLWDSQYRPTNGGDDDLETSVWQVKAIYAGRLMGSTMQGLSEALKAAADGCSTLPEAPNAATAPFLIQPLQILHRNRDATYVAALDVLRGAEMDWGKPAVSDPVVHWYMTVQALFRHGGEAWNRWNRISVPNLVRGQTVEKANNGTELGYWDSTGRGEKFGRIYSTALCSLMLQVYYPVSMRPVYDPEEPTTDDGNKQDITIDIR